MSCYVCTACQQLKDGDLVNYRCVTEPGGNILDICEDCYPAVLAEHVNGDRELEAVEFKSLADHFVCPDCLEVFPDSEQRYSSQTGEFYCPVCATARPGCIA